MGVEEGGWERSWDVWVDEVRDGERGAEEVRRRRGEVGRERLDEGVEGEEEGEVWWERSGRRER